MFLISLSDEIFPIDIVESSVEEKRDEGCFEKESHTITIKKEKQTDKIKNKKE
jgi:hypothetical protein